MGSERAGSIPTLPPTSHLTFSQVTSAIRASIALSVQYVYKLVPHKTFWRKKKVIFAYKGLAQCLANGKYSRTLFYSIESLFPNRDLWKRICLSSLSQTVRESFIIPYRSISSLFTSPVVPFWICSSLLMSLLKCRTKDEIETISQDLKYSPYAVFPAIPDSLSL